MRTVTNRVTRTELRLTGGNCARGGIVEFNDVTIDSHFNCRSRNAEFVKCGSVISRAIRNLNDNLSSTPVVDGYSQKARSNIYTIGSTGLLVPRPGLPMKELTRSLGACVEVDSEGSTNPGRHCLSSEGQKHRNNSDRSSPDR